MGKKKVKTLSEKSELEEASPPASAKIEEAAKVKAVPSSKTAPARKKGTDRSPKYRRAAAQVIKGKAYSLTEAIRMTKETAYGRFNAAIEVHFKLGLDVTKDDQKIRTTVVLPKGTGKSPKILAFVPVDSINAARAAGADLIGDEKKIEEIGKGVIDFDVVVSETSFMPKLAKVARILGPKGLMPNPKSGTSSNDPVKAILEVKRGKIELKTETNAPLLHTIIGKKDFPEEDLRENFTAVYNALRSAKPAKTKGVFIQGLTLSATMGPGIKVDPASLL